MRTYRIYSPAVLEENKRVVLDDDGRRHLVQVLRLKPGDSLVLFDGSGRDYAATLERVDKRECVARVGQVLGEEASAPLRISLAIGISRGERMDFGIQKAVELGVSDIQPLFTGRSVVQLKGERLQNRLEHWRGVIRHACEQSGRSRLPTLWPATSLTSWLADFTGNGVMLDHRADQLLVELPAPGATITLLVGPEGGLAAKEREQASNAGLRGVRLGPRVLRTETAPLAALSVIQGLWGDFR